MKRAAILLPLLILLVARAAPPAPRPVPVQFQWSPDTNNFGGMSTNDYYTNIIFNVFSSTNCAIPTNQWPLVAQWLASTFPSKDGLNWSNAVVIDGLTRFYLMNAASLSAGTNGPFSNLDVWVPAPTSGLLLNRVGP